MIISMIVSAIVNVLAGIVKGIFSMFFFFIRMFWKLIRLLLTILPVTGCLFTAIYLLQAADLILKRDPLPSIFPFHPDYTVTAFFWGQLSTWWTSSVTGYRGTPVYYLIVLFTIILVVPVMGSLLFIASFRSAVSWLTITAGIDILYYLLRSIIGRVTPFSQITDRFYALFPDVGDQHYDHAYRKWLRRHHEEFEEYDDDDNDEDDYNDENDYGNDDEDYDYDDEYDEPDPEYADRNFFSSRSPFQRDRIKSNARRKLDQFYADSDEEDASNEYKYRYDSQHEKEDDTTSVNNTSTGNGFDFFAGCTSSDSAEKKYHTLVKLYHPDNMDGDTNAIQEINIQYDKIKKRLR